MTRLRASRTTARLVLAWFVAFIAFGSLAAIAEPQRLQVVCSGTGAGLLVVDVEAPGGKSAFSHGVECPLCLPLAAPPPADPQTVAPAAPAIAALLAASAAPAARAAAAPPPARGPPSFV